MRSKFSSTAQGSPVDRK
uniref:Uncharacterized protein n=1 Tax=Rhizophora mucronata TaxID=61149 RepID=A0A2P2P3J7_RHIMU